MKRILRKVASIFIATAMVAAMGVSAFAAPIGDDGIKEGNNLGDPVGDEITLYKELKAYNPDETKIQAPNISYRYEITAGDADKQITDDQNVRVKTKAGILTGLTTVYTVAWTDNDILDAAENGAANLKDIKINFSAVPFTGAGVYRYKITETMTDGFTKPTSGVTDGGISDIRYLDVYVKDGTTAGEYVIYGYVCFTNNLDHINDGSDKTTSAATAAVKTKGFVDASEVDPATTSDLTADSYYTYNVTVGKTLVNDNANINNEFPFTVTFKNTAIKQKVNLISKNTGTVTLPEIDAAKIESDLVSEPTIASAGSVKYIGIPIGTQITVKEKNNVPTAAYKSVGTITEGKDTTNDQDAAEKLINLNDDSNIVTIADNTIDAKGTNRVVDFTNTLELISPTGVAMAILPFVILLGFGIGFMVLGTTKRKEEYEV